MMVANQNDGLHVYLSADKCNFQKREIYKEILVPIILKASIKHVVLFFLQEELFF